METDEQILWLVFGMAGWLSNESGALAWMQVQQIQQPHARSMDSCLDKEQGHLTKYFSGPLYSQFTPAACMRETPC